MKLLRSLNLLLVEDDIQICNTLKESLKYFFAKVYTAHDGVEALNIIRSDTKIDTIFTDYEMPNMNGYEMIKEIRTFDKKIPITVFSNYSDKEKMQKCMPLGLCGYLFKPLKFDDFKVYMVDLEERFDEMGLLQYSFGDDFVFDIQNVVLSSQDTTYQLTKLEGEFLKLFASLDDKVATFDMIFEHLSEFEPTKSSITDLVYRIKNKYRFTCIKNIKDIGYIVVV